MCLVSSLLAGDSNLLTASVDVDVHFTQIREPRFDRGRIQLREVDIDAAIWPERISGRSRR
jgi:hypothetical protein